MYCAQAAEENPAIVSFGIRIIKHIGGTPRFRRLMCGVLYSRRCGMGVGRPGTWFLVVTMNSRRFR